MKTKHAPFSLYKKKIGKIEMWYARFWDPTRKSYAVHRATGVEVGKGKKERKGEAERAANELLSTVIFNISTMKMTDYLENFWKEDSPYFQESEAIKKKKLSHGYSKASLALLSNHIRPFPPFAGITLGDLSTKLLRDYMLWESKRGVSNTRINRALQVIRVPLRYALSRGETGNDPFLMVNPAVEDHRERGVLSREETLRLIAAPAEDTRRRIAVLLGVLCGLRLGEVRGLRWENIDMKRNIIRVMENWQDIEGSKAPKAESFREVPLVKPLKELFEVYLREGGSGSGLVFNREKDGNPSCAGYFRTAKEVELAAIGIPGPWRSRKAAPEGYVNEQEARNISFHSLRHTFVSLCRLAGMNDFQIQALAGHRSAQMMNRYSHPCQVVETSVCKNLLENFF